jgi:hypothetical protein
VTKKSKKSPRQNYGKKNKFPTSSSVQKDLPDIDKRWSDNMKYDDPNNILKFTLTIAPDDGKKKKKKITSRNLERTSSYFHI